MLQQMVSGGSVVTHMGLGEETGSFWQQNFKDIHANLSIWQEYMSDSEADRVALIVHLHTYIWM